MKIPQPNTVNKPTYADIVKGKSSPKDNNAADRMIEQLSSLSGSNPVLHVK